ITACDAFEQQPRYDSNEDTQHQFRVCTASGADDVVASASILWIVGSVSGQRHRYAVHGNHAAKTSQTRHSSSSSQVMGGLKSQRPLDYAAAAAAARSQTPQPISGAPAASYLRSNSLSSRALPNSNGPACASAASWPH